MRGDRDSREVRQTLTQQTRSFVLGKITTGEFAPGQRIPTERELCTRLGVSRITVRAALLSLTQEGILYRRSGSGTFVNHDLSRTGTVAFLRCEHGPLAHEMRNDFVYSEVLEGIQTELRSQGRDLIFSYVREQSEDSRKVLEGISSKADGFILGEMRTDYFYNVVEEMHRPVVLVNPEIPYYSRDSVEYDNLAGSVKAMEYLIGLGHRIIGFINGRMPTKHAAERLSGYKFAIERHNLDFHASLITGGRDWQSDTGYTSAKDLIKNKQGITAIFAANDAIAVGAIKGLRDSGVRVPEDISVIGFDDMVIASYAEPPLTTLRVDRNLMGKAAARRLLELVGSPNQQKIKTLFVPELVVRQSCIRL